jgi:hypothetical protein
LFQEDEPFFIAGRHDGLMALLPQRLCEKVAHGNFVVNDQDLHRGNTPAATGVNAVPGRQHGGFTICQKGETVQLVTSLVMSAVGGVGIVTVLA